MGPVRRLPRKNPKSSTFVAFASSASDCALAAMANFQPISTGILKEHGIVSWPFVISRSFDVLGAGVAGNLSQPPALCRPLSPKRDTAAVRPVHRRFSDPKKVRRPGRLAGFELQPSLDGYTAPEGQVGDPGFRAAD